MAIVKNCKDWISSRDVYTYKEFRIQQNTTQYHHSTLPPPHHPPNIPIPQPHHPPIPIPPLLIEPTPLNLTREKQLIQPIPILPPFNLQPSQQITLAVRIPRIQAPGVGEAVEVAAHGALAPWAAVIEVAGGAAAGCGHGDAGAGGAGAGGVGGLRGVVVGVGWGWGWEVGVWLWVGV